MHEKKPFDIIPHCKTGEHVTYALDNGTMSLLLSDSPEKRRRVYFEFTHAQPQQVIRQLETAGFDISTLKNLRQIQRDTMQIQHAISCFITGPVNTILAFLKRNQHISLASIDFPEYTLVSAGNEIAPS